jgi:hypothetical protein
LFTGYLHELTALCELHGIEPTELKPISGAEYLGRAFFWPLDAASLPFGGEKSTLILTVLCQSPRDFSAVMINNRENEFELMPSSA